MAYPPSQATIATPTSAANRRVPAPATRAPLFFDFATVREGRLPRPPTPWQRVLTHILRDRKRKLGMKILRLLPVSLQDRILEKRYRAVMGNVELDGVKPKSVKMPQEIEREAA